MKKIKFKDIENFDIDEEFDIGVFTVEGVEYTFLGGDLCPDGQRNYLRPLGKVKASLRNRQKWHSDNYANSKVDVALYMGNKDAAMATSLIEDLFYERNRQKW